jgi:hypothetical protein
MPQFVTVTSRRRNGDGSKGALYRETLQATGFYVGRIVIATAEFAPMPPVPLPGYPGGLIPMAIGTRFSRHDGIYRSDVVENQTHQPNPGDGIEPPPADPPRTQVKERAGRITPLIVRDEFRPAIPRSGCSPAEPVSASPTRSE